MAARVVKLYTYGIFQLHVRLQLLAWSRTGLDTRLSAPGAQDMTIHTTWTAILLDAREPERIKSAGGSTCAGHDQSCIRPFRIFVTEAPRQIWHTIDLS